MDLKTSLGALGGELSAAQPANRVWMPRRARTVLGPTGVGENEKVASNVSMSTNIRSRSLVGSGRLAVRIFVRVVDPTVFARWPREACQSLQCRKIVSITSPCGGSMKAMTFIWPPHSGQDNGSISYTRCWKVSKCWSSSRHSSEACGSRGRYSGSGSTHALRHSRKRSAGQ